MHEVAKRVPGVKPPAVWLPHTVLGISNAGMIEDVTGGKFGPFSGQFFLADQGQSKIVRLSFESVKDVWQGAAYPFREGFECGIIRLAYGEDGALFAGETARGWGSVGPKEFGLERLTWSGRTRRACDPHAGPGNAFEELPREVVRVRSALPWPRGANIDRGRPPTALTGLAEQRGARPRADS